MQNNQDSDDHIQNENKSQKDQLIIDEEEKKEG